MRTFSSSFAVVACSLLAPFSLLACGNGDDDAEAGATAASLTYSTPSYGSTMCVPYALFEGATLYVSCPATDAGALSFGLAIAGFDGDGDYSFTGFLPSYLLVGAGGTTFTAEPNAPEGGSHCAVMVTAPTVPAVGERVVGQFQCVDLDSLPDEAGVIPTTDVSGSFSATIIAPDH